MTAHNEIWECACKTSNRHTPETVTCLSCHVHNPYLLELARNFVPTATPKPYTERDIIELMARAPAVPEWFEPDMTGIDTGFVAVGYTFEFVKNQPNTTISTAYDSEGHLEGWQKRREKTIQWPRAYALMVLEAK